MISGSSCGIYLFPHVRRTAIYRAITNRDVCSQHMHSLVWSPLFGLQNYTDSSARRLTVLVDGKDPDFISRLFNKGQFILTLRFFEVKYKCLKVEHTKILC